ncbi:MAG: DUF6062 family protein [Clostridia bacterium]
MKEKIYTIPVNDAFNADCECPVCLLERTLENNTIDFFLGPSYMEGDVRLETNRKGFCRRHSEKLYRHEGDKLGLALMMETHFEHILAEVRKANKKAFSEKKESLSSVSQTLRILEELEHTCAACDRIQRIMEKYVDTILWMYARDNTFRDKVRTGKGFCLKHYRMLLERAKTSYSSKNLRSFHRELALLMESNMDRLLADVCWFCQKFDYRNLDAPWKTSKDCLPRAIEKCTSYLG